MHVWLEISTWCNSATCTHQKLPRILQVPCSMHPEDVCEYHYINSGLHEPVYDYSSPAARALHQPRRAPRLLVSGRTRSTSTSSCTASTRHHSPGCSDLPRLRRASGCLGTSRGSSRGSSRRSSSTTPPRPGSSLTTPPRVRVPRHVAWLVTRLVVPLIVDYTARLGASARRAARHAARRTARRRLLRLRRASGCLGTSRGLSSTTPPYTGSSSTTPPRARSSSTTPPRAGLSSTTSPPPRARVPRHVARLVARIVRRLVVDYSVRRDFVLRPHWLYFSHAVRCGYLSRGNTGSTSSTPRAAATSSFGRIASTIHLD
jgi:hypothetical protein